MVVHTVVISRQARANLRAIYDYLKEEVSATTATKVRDGILDTIEELANMPSRHTIVSEISDKKSTYRRVLKWEYKIIYSINENKLTVRVVEIVHSKQKSDNWMKKY